MNTNEMTELMSREFTFGDKPFTLDSIPLSAAVYLIAYGARQSSVDTDAAYAAFVGQKEDGSVPANAKSRKQREAIAKELGHTGYDDAKLADRNGLASAYFARALDDKWRRICDGTLTVANRGRGNPDETAMAGFAERDLMVYLGTQGKTKSGVIKTRRTARAELSDETDAAVWKTIVADYLEANRPDYESELADSKAKAAANAERMKRDGWFTI